MAFVWKADSRTASRADHKTNKWPLRLRVWFILAASLALWGIILAAILTLIP